MRNKKETKIEDLTDEEKEIIGHCLKEHAPSYVPLLYYLDKLKADAIYDVRDAIGAELAKKGFTDYDEPNEYGLVLENLMTKLANLYIWPERFTKRKKWPFRLFSRK